ncbi:MAG: hypothetical protein MUO76_08070 [Anaerolineaceae bacterium]|nr:hypothetical protein [Anaerolineaceae bacterium]
MNYFIRKKSKLLTGLSLPVILMILLLLAACGGEGETASAPADTVQPEVVEEEPAAAETSEEGSTGAETIEVGAPPAEVGVVSFSQDVMPVLSSRCFQCHGGDSTEGGFVILSYAEIMIGSRSGTVIVPGDAAASLLVELVTTQVMPKRGPKLTSVQVQLITDWVDQGALDN